MTRTETALNISIENAVALPSADSSSPLGDHEPASRQFFPAPLAESRANGWLTQRWDGMTTGYAYTFFDRMYLFSGSTPSSATPGSARPPQSKTPRQAVEARRCFPTVT
jgi:hypothetical protein